MSPVRVVEVGPRDGLQNEATAVPTDVKVAFINALAAAGLAEIEATSFVSPKWVPQLADAPEVWRQLDMTKAAFSALVPNVRGLETALSVGVRRIALFTAASETFTQRNINMGIDESLMVFRDVVQRFRAATPGSWVRGYISTAVACPYEGKVSEAAVARVFEQLLRMGVDEISVGDTIGVAVPRDVERVQRALSSLQDASKWAWHFHDTRGTAIANVAKSLELGSRIFDSSAGGLGGCPYAPGAGGNLATEDLLYFLEASGIPTVARLTEVARASLPVLQVLGREPQAKAQRAALAA